MAQRKLILRLESIVCTYTVRPLKSLLSFTEDKSQDRDALESIGTTGVGNCLLSSRPMVRIHQGAFQTYCGAVDLGLLALGSLHSR